jgi:protein-L-isoaspartate(D-aspartate) O-methyltransferase
MVALMIEALELTGPERVLEQLKIPGYLVFPMGEEELQTLVRIRKDRTGLREEYLGECRFVKLMGRYGWEV